MKRERAARSAANPSAKPPAGAESNARRTRHAPHKVRIIGGRWKRTPIVVPDLPGLRPTPDRVRETVFNWLVFLRPDFGRLRVLDLFAGTGVLGFEAASRGAAHVTLVERAAPLLAQMRALRERLRADPVDIRAGDVLAVAARLPAASFDLVFVDPPYESGLHAPALAAARRLLAAGGLVYTESDSALDVGAAGFEPVRSDRAGRVVYWLLRARGESLD
jgi:16S rRNA (guanine(966)-N(2))-methyltransferase RsmD